MNRSRTRTDSSASDDENFDAESQHLETEQTQSWATRIGRAVGINPDTIKTGVVSVACSVVGGVIMYMVDSDPTVSNAYKAKYAAVIGMTCGIVGGSLYVGIIDCLRNHGRPEAHARAVADSRVPAAAER